MKRREFLKTGAAVLGGAVMSDKMSSVMSGESRAEAAVTAGKGVQRRFETCLGPYNLKAVDVALPEEVILCDVTLRDGEQTAGVAFSLEEKVDCARRLSDLGIPQIQIGRADSAHGRKEAETLCRLGLASKIEIMTAAGSKDWRSHVDAALACGADIVHSNIATSTYMRNMQGDIPESEVIKRLEEIVTYMRKRGAKIVNISIMDATRTEETFLLEVVRHMGQLGVDRFRIADTVGTCTPEGIFYLITRVRETLSAFPRPPIIGIHCHNDFGLVLANVFAAVKAGARLIDVTLNGLGERAGNPALVEVAIGLEALYGVNTKLQLGRLYEISRYGEKISALPLPSNKPFVGEHACADQSDGHVKAYLDNPWAFEGIKPAVFGNRRKIIVGIKTGKNILEHKIRELKLNVPSDRYPQILERIRALSLQNKGKVLTDADLIKIIQQL